MRFVIVTGMSGAGKTTALKMLEDMGYFCVDNLPIAMFPGFVQMIENSETPMKKVALGVDVRSGQDISGLEKDLEQMDQKGIKYEILFLDAKDSVLVKRYKETRRQHPLSGSGRVDTGIAKEREKTAFLKTYLIYILASSPSKAWTTANPIRRSKPCWTNPSLRHSRNSMVSKSRHRRTSCPTAKRSVRWASIPTAFPALSKPCSTASAKARGCPILIRW